MPQESVSHAVGRGGELVGRERERERVSQLVRDVERDPRTLVLAGEAGIGKTRLWREATEEAERRGVQVLVARAACGEVQLAFAVLGDLLAGVVDDVLPALAPPQRRALEAALLL